MAIEKKNYRMIRYREKKNDILKSGASVFAEKGFEKATLDEIADALKMTKGSLYYYIRSKADMLFQCIMKALEMANEGLREVGRMDLPPELKLRKAIVSHIEVLTTDFVVGTIRQQELLLPEKMRNEVIRERDKFEKKFLSIIREGIEAGVFEPDGWKMKGYAILGALNWIPRWYSKEGEFLPAEIAEIMADYLIKGLKKCDVAKTHGSLATGISCKNPRGKGENKTKIFAQ